MANFSSTFLIIMIMGTFVVIQLNNNPITRVFTFIGIFSSKHIIPDQKQRTGGKGQQ